MTKKDLQILAKAAKDPWYFSSFAKVVNPILGVVPFDLYPFQRSVLYAFLFHQFNIVLKARQMGLTELIGLYTLWLAMFHPHKNIVIISLKDRVARKLLRRIKHIYINLPPILQTPIVNGRKGEFGTGSEMIFSNGSSIVSLPTTEDAGRSEAATLLVMDEAAIMQMADTIWTAAFPTLATGGAAIINSTPYGIGNWYYNTWTDGIHGINGFNNIKLTWDMHPDRDLDWYTKMRGALGAKRTAQEIDGDFLASGDTVFDLADIKDIEEYLVDCPPIETRLNGNLLIFKKPEKGKQYFMGVDVATGRATDYSAFTVMDRQGDEVAVFKGRIPTNRLRDIAMGIGMEYNQALLAIEANDIGEGVVSGAQERGYPNLYHTRQVVKEKRSAKPTIKKIPGWYTTRANRGLIIDGLETDIREATIDIKDPFFVTEAYTFIYDTANRPVAMQKGESISGSDATYTDDDIMAKSICNHIRKGKYIPKNATTSPR